MKRFLTAAALFFSLMGSAAVQAAPSRSQTIQAASQLGYTASQIANYARMRGFPNTYSNIFAIAEQAGRIEYAARYLSVTDAQMATNEAVRYYLAARPHIATIYSINEQNYIRSNVRYALNQLLYVLGETVPLGYTACSSADNCAASYDDNPSSIMSMGGSWAEEGGGMGPSFPNSSPSGGGWDR